MIFDGAQRPPRISGPLLSGSPTSAPPWRARWGGYAGRARAQSKDLRFFLLISMWPAFLSTCLLITTFTGDVIAGPEEVRIPPGRHPTKSRFGLRQSFLIEE